MAKTQIQKFRETARALESEETEGRFNDTLRHVARHKPSSEPPKDAPAPKYLRGKQAKRKKG